MLTYTGLLLIYTFFLTYQQSSLYCNHNTADLTFLNQLSNFTKINSTLKT